MRAKLDAPVVKAPTSIVTKRFNSKGKGGNWERQICHLLSQWISNGKRSDVFWRSAMSGGRATITLANKEQKLKAQAGDISSIASLGERLLDHFIIEAKFYQNLHLMSAIIKESGLLFDFWVELKNKSIIYGKQPLLIAKQNNVPAFCIMTPEAMGVFKLEPVHTAAILPRQGMVIVLFDVFLREAQVPESDVYIETMKPKRVRLL
jgi:hypothetical protein